MARRTARASVRQARHVAAEVAALATAETDFTVLHVKSALDDAGVPLLRGRFLRHLDLLADASPTGALSPQAAWDRLEEREPDAAACLLGCVGGDTIESLSRRFGCSPARARRLVRRALDLLLVWTCAPAAERAPAATLAYLARLRGVASPLDGASE